MIGRKMAVCLVLVICLLIPLVSGAVSASDKILIRVGSIQAENFYLHDYVNKFAELVAEKTGNRVEVQLFPSSVLGNERDMLEGLQIGSLEAVMGYTAVQATIEPRIDVLNLPFMFRDYDHVQKVLNGPIGEELGEAFLQKTGIRVMFWVNHAFRHVFTCDKQVNKISDFHGLKIRTPESPIYIAIFRALGANPTPMAFGEIYTSLQTKLIDGHEQEYSGMLSMNFHEVEKYCVETYHLYNGSALYMSDRWLQKQPEDIRKAIETSAVEAGMWFRMHGGEVAQESAKIELEKLGLKITVLDQAELREILYPLQDEMAEKIGATDLLERIRAVK